MKRTLEGVMPVGTPWGGPESRTYLSSFVSMLMHLEKHQGTERELQAAHERLYHLYLAVSGIGVSTVSAERDGDTWPAFSHEKMVDRLFDDYVERTMAYAGRAYSVATAQDIRADTDAVRRRIVASIDRGAPVLACSAASEWSVVTGYHDDGKTLVGWDGAHTYWGRPAVEPDRYLENGMFATASWPDAVARFVIAEGAIAPSRSSKEVLAHLIAVIERQRPRGCDTEFKAALADDAYCRSAPEASWRGLWGHVDGYVGWYAENRCFTGSALGELLPEMGDVHGHDAVVGSLKRAADLMGHTHDLCWEAWRTLRVAHACGLPDEEPCRMCGGCLRPPVDEDYQAFREAGPRGKLLAYLQVIASNDARMLAELKGCAAAL